jgi:membrane protease YdiL (CAAX protease family)
MPFTEPVILELRKFLYLPEQPEKFYPMSLVDFLKLFIITSLFVAPYSALFYTLGLFEMQNEVMDLLEENLTVFLITAIIFAPIIEEPIFRLHLDLTKKSILWSLGVSVILFFDSWIAVGVFWIYLIWLFVRVSRNNPPSLKLVVYISAILFGLIHLSNFTSLDYATQFYLIPLLIGEQVIMGLLFSFIRLRYGMKWAMIYHGLYNGFFTVAYLLIFGVE